MSTKPDISIITITFNSIAYIEACIQNVISQKCNFIEHIIVDGASTDGTAEVINRYAAEYSHIKAISEPDNGQCDAMNKAIQLANANYIGFLNVDDGYMPFTLNRVREIVLRYNKPVFVTGNCKLVDVNNNLLYINRPQKLKPYHFYSGKEVYPINPSAYFYHKEIHNNSNVGLYNINNHYSMDYEFMLKASLYYPFIYFNEDWGYMLQHKDAKTTKDSKNTETRKKELLTEYFQTIPLLLQLKVLIYKIYKAIK